MDRTAEFAALLRQNTSQTSASTHTPSSELSEFNQAAGEIGNAIHGTQLKLGELGKLARSKSLFNDQTTEINRLIADIREDLMILTQRINRLTEESGAGGNRAMQQHCTSVCNTLNLRVTELTKGFRDALELRTKTMQEVEQRKNKYSNAAVANDLNVFGNKQDIDLESGRKIERTQMLGQSSSYHFSRAQAAQQMNAMISEISSMFQKMSHMIVQQEEQIRRIDQDVDDTLGNVDRGHSELLRYFNNISGNRSLIVKVFLILIFFIVFSTVFLS